MILDQFKDNYILIVPFLLSIFYCFTIHEFAHAFAAYKQGDDTAKEAGRLTLNPLAHIDLLGFLMFIFAGFGWAKPTPVNPNNFRDGKKGDNLVSIAGILANVASVIVFGIIFKIVFPDLNPVLLQMDFNFYPSVNLLSYFLSSLIVYNLILAIFNILPIPPLDGSHILFNQLSDRFINFKIFLTSNGVFILLALLILENFGIYTISYLFALAQIFLALFF